MSAAARATSVAPSTDRPTWAAWIAGASLMPSPRKPVTWPRLRSASMMRFFWSGSTRAKRSICSTFAARPTSVDLLDLCRETDVGELRYLGAGQNAFMRQSHGFRHMLHDGGLIA
jgi:hypothetical protein